MNKKKIIVILIILAIVGAGSFYFQKNKKEKTIVAHNTLKFQKMITAAKKSNTSGLLPMASAINKYHQVKRHYPKILMDLYPDFIIEEDFISTLNWQYYPNKGGYLLKRSIDGQNTFASIGPDFKLKTGLIKPPPVGVDSKQSRVAETKIDKPVILASIKPEPDILSLTQPEKIDEKQFIPEVKKTVPALNAKKDENESSSESSIEIIKEELYDDEKYLLSFDSDRFYIWKTKDGFIGFSNIKYPDLEELTMYKDQNWIKYSVNKNNKVIK